MKNVAILHQGLDSGDPSIIRHSSILRDSLVEVVRELGYDPRSVYLDDSFRWVSELERTRNLLVVVNAADYGPFFDSTLESIVPAILDKKGIRYTGSDRFALDVSNDKLESKKTLRDLGIPVPFCVSVDEIPKNVSYPLILKYRFIHGSEGIDNNSVVSNKVELLKKVEELRRVKNVPIIAEQYIQSEGVKEVCAGFVGNGAERIVLPIAAVSFKGSMPIRTYDAKWSDENCIEFLDLTDQLRRDIELYTSQVADAFGIRDYARIDFRLCYEGDRQVPYAIDINANPDLNKDATVYTMASRIGFSYKKFIRKIIEASLRR